VTVTVSHCSATTTITCFKSTQRQLTVMLVTICCAAVCLQLPYTILYLLNAEKQLLWPDHKTLHANIYLYKTVTDVVATSSYAVNFALYCVSGSAFRRNVRTMCQRRQKLQRQAIIGLRHQPATSISMSTAVTSANANRLTVAPLRDKHSQNE